ncbi:hypothetical protein OB919_18170 [Halobacteria archaeon AArc-curdl1]|uniref:Uncharacterized protein n=1 Tax=Natronosalvus hydrolyticus TaxID=2979988 RepID=A0AAP3E8H4_9EURY|nr:hypothetical protein [Halobacteria archaeon AArc-curdl1]
MLNNPFATIRGCVVAHCSFGRHFGGQRTVFPALMSDETRRDRLLQVATGNGHNMTTNRPCTHDED